MQCFPISQDKIILWYTSSHFLPIVPFFPSPSRRERFYLFSPQGRDMAELPDFCFQIKQGWRKERLGGRSQEQGHMLPIPSQFPKADLSLEFPTSPKTTCSKHSTAAGSPGKRTVQIVSTFTKSSVERHHTNP